MVRYSDAVAATLRRVARAPGMGPLRKLPAADRMADALYYARNVGQSGRFFLRELFGVGIGRYRPRGATLDVFVRHRTSDRYILNEIFGYGLYRPPPEALAALSRLARPLRIVDLGGHVGLFGVFVLSCFRDAQVVSVEADPLNAAVLARCIAINRQEQTWRLISGVADTAAGTVPTLVGRFAESRVAPGDPGAIEVEAIDILPMLSGADYVKIDVEGSEWAIFADPRFADLSAVLVVVEYHLHGCPSADPRGEALSLFQRLGFRTSEIAVPHAAPGVGMLWAWR